ncbi:Uu.00g003620.m01.CDS01 [Anthostomella pinea]|uniref:Uu.00g003620.m01.CDS01 n=1 Tax=Anthostomella pinea TaxID=933095 RepID=A0AAI8VKE5_9PEZI|nr:Uu.00g003620.m01.CDS01 [Anthostomella pinea]
MSLADASRIPPRKPRKDELSLIKHPRVAVMTWPVIMGVVYLVVRKFARPGVLRASRGFLFLVGGIGTLRSVQDLWDARRIAAKRDEWELRMRSQRSGQLSGFGPASRAVAGQSEVGDWMRSDNLVSARIADRVTLAAKKSWRGCGSHIPSALSGVPEDQWCTCEPPVMINGKAYPPAASFEIPGLSWLTSWFGGGAGGGGGAAKGGSPKGKDEL